MKFAVLQFFSWPERRVPLGKVYERALERVQIMDKTGYDAVWLAEHHFSTYSVCPSIHLMGMHIADTTENIRIGTGVSLAAFYHPLRLAEEVALLDNLSGGRINWGAGRGFDKTEMTAFGVEAAESSARLHENVDVVLAAWNNERLTFHGEYNHFDNIEVLPKPIQNPMPTWIASSSPDAIAWSASQGHAILMDPHSTHQEIAHKYRSYRDQLAEHGHNEARDTPIARLLAIADTDEKAEAVARAGAQWTVGSYANPKSGSGMMSGFSTEDRVDRYVNEIIIHGSPSTVTDKLKELEETMPLDYLMASILSHETFMRLSEEVMPNLR